MTPDRAPGLWVGQRVVDNPAARMPGESHAEHASRLYGMYRALLNDVDARYRPIEREARALLADLDDYGDLGAAASVQRLREVLAR